MKCYRISYLVFKYSTYHILLHEILVVATFMIIPILHAEQFTEYQYLSERPSLKEID